MSLSTRTAVLESMRYKPVDHWSMWVVPIFMAYVLFTRTITDLEQTWWPFYLGIVGLHFIGGVGIAIAYREFPDLWDVLYWCGLAIVFDVSITLYMYGGIALAYDSWQWLTTKFDPLASRSQFIFWTGLTTIGAGLLFFQFRLRQRFIYGLTEACVGVLVAMHRVTMEEWPGVPKSTAFYVALLTAGIYLVVRGLDNMYQARRDGDVMAKRFINFVLRRSELKPINVLRLRTHRHRQRNAWKKGRPIKPSLFDRMLDGF